MYSSCPFLSWVNPWWVPVEIEYSQERDPAGFVYAGELVLVPVGVVTRLLTLPANPQLTKIRTWWWSNNGGGDVIGTLEWRANGSLLAGDRSIVQLGQRGTPIMVPVAFDLLPDHVLTVDLATAVAGGADRIKIGLSGWRVPLLGGCA